MAPKTNIYIVRHGESEHNVKKQFGIIPAAKLTSKGKKQASTLEKQFKNIYFDCVFSSDLTRAKETAEIICVNKKLAVNTSVILRERSYGRLNGKTEGEIQEDLKEHYDRYKNMSDKQKYSHKLVDDMETTEETLARVFVYLQKLAKTCPGKTILIVSHSTVMRSLLVHLGFADHHEIDRDCIANTAYMKLEANGSYFILKETFGISKKI